VRYIEHTSRFVDILQESNLENTYNFYGHPAEIPKLKPGRKHHYTEPGYSICGAPFKKSSTELTSIGNEAIKQIQGNSVNPPHCTSLDSCIVCTILPLTLAHVIVSNKSYSLQISAVEVRT
jgi:hypothetical protein